MSHYAVAPRQSAFPGLCPLDSAVDDLAKAGGESRGAIFTKREVVEFILDLVGYTAEKPLHKYRLLEPSFGGGEFITAAVERLMTAYRRDGASAAGLSDAIRAVELHRNTFESTKSHLVSLLSQHGLSQNDARSICSTWLVRDDFLLTPLEGSFTHVVGNPPYVRQELIPQVLINEYRRLYSTIFDRADLYVPFIERSLRLLTKGGTLGFICADRWTKNRYGGPLRRLIADHFHLRTYVDMVDTPAFRSDVIAYPAIYVISSGTSGATRLAHRPSIEKQNLLKLANELTAENAALPSIKQVRIATHGNEPWIFESLDQLVVVRRLEQRFPSIEDAGCKVGIGVATGADNAFIGPLGELDVEADRKLPLVMTNDIRTGKIEWRGRGVINPFTNGGGLVDLAKYPQLRRYLEARKSQIAKRHVARKAPVNWYRTIDRIYPELVAKPKLLIPDIKGEAHVVFDAGNYYPHHNLYYIISDAWDLRALQAVLRSGIARLFVSTYSTKMRGGYLRFQAQYLRRIRIPQWKDVPGKLRQFLADAGPRTDPADCDIAVRELYKLEAHEATFLAQGAR